MNPQFVAFHISASVSFYLQQNICEGKSLSPRWLKNTKVLMCLLKDRFYFNNFHFSKDEHSKNSYDVCTRKTLCKTVSTAGCLVHVCLIPLLATIHHTNAFVLSPLPATIDRVINQVKRLSIKH